MVDPEGRGGQIPGPAAVDALGGVAVPSYLVLDVRGMAPDAVANLRADLFDTWAVQSAEPLDRLAPALGRLFAPPPEALHVGTTATKEQFVSYFDPTGTDAGGKSMAGITWSMLRQESGRRQPADLVEMNPRAYELLSGLFIRTEPAESDPRNLKGILDVEALRELLEIGYDVVLDIRNIGGGRARALTGYVNDTLRLEGEDRLPLR